MANRAEERLDVVLSAKVSRGEREGMKELAQRYGKSESEIVREMVKLLVRAYEDAKTQAATGTSAEDLLDRVTRLALVNVMGGLSPSELRQIAATLTEAANKLADLLEKPGAA
jgi:hypothetical protein